MSYAHGAHRCNGTIGLLITPICSLFPSFTVYFRIRLLTQGEKPPKRTFISFFGKGQSSTIHPADVETGSGHEKSKTRFSQAPPQYDNLKMVRAMIC